jgi:hypothetical protein
VVELAIQTTLFGIGVQLRAVRLFGGEHGADDARELVGGGHQGGGTAKLASHTPVKLAEFVLGVMQPLGRQSQRSRRAVGAGFGKSTQKLAAGYYRKGAA